MKTILGILLLVTLAAADIRVATWNVYDWNYPRAAISALAAEVNADVWCLQEANGREFDPLFVDVPQIQEGRAETVDGVWIASVHLSVSGGSHYSAMVALLATYPGGPGIIAGDFNENPIPAPIFYELYGKMAVDALAAAGWVRVDTPVQPPSTLPLASPGSRLTHGMGRIDQIWVTPDIEILACGIPPSPWMRDGQYLSDHAPVWADVAIPEPPVLVLLLTGLLPLRRRR